MQPRRTLLAAVLAAAAMAALAPAADASTTLLPWPGGAGAVGVGAPGSLGATGCGPAHGSEGQGAVGVTENSVCGGVNLVFVGPAVGNVSSVIGPTIMGPGFAGQVIVGNGATAAGP
jgi:hypothetical protein